MSTATKGSEDPVKAHACMAKAFNPDNTTKNPGMAEYFLMAVKGLYEHKRYGEALTDVYNGSVCLSEVEDPEILESYATNALEIFTTVHASGFLASDPEIFTSDSAINNISYTFGK